MASDSWSPAKYEEFKRERSQPFFDLLDLLPAGLKAARAIDLGCGTGELTAEACQRFACGQMVGLDASPAMLERAAAHESKALSFVQGDLGQPPEGPFDLLLSNAAIQWVDDHEALLPRLVSRLAPGGWLAVQLPSNHDHASHATATEVAQRPGFAALLGGYVRRSPVLPLERYGEILAGLGLQQLHVSTRAYVHRLPDSAAVVEWVRGTLLTDYERRMPKERWPEFLDAYRSALLARLGERAPYDLVFKRTFLVGRRPE